MSVFYQANPPELSPRGRPCSNYFGIYWHEKQLMICNAESAFSEGLIGGVAKNGDVIISRFRHDYVVSEDGTSMMDGGRDYIRSNGCRTVRIGIDKSKLIILGD